jgi:beta-glucosidase
MVSSLYHDHLAKLIESGQIPASALDESVKRVLRVKFALGLFDHPYTNEAAEQSSMLRPEYLQVAREAAERSFVLLKNDARGGSPLLPLSKTLRKIALIGPLADDAADMLGSWSAQGKSEDVISLRSALAAQFGNDKIIYAKGTDIAAAGESGIDDAVRAARQADVVILALGENASEMTGEASSRAKPGLPGRQQQLLEKVVETGKPVVLLLFSGRPLMIPWAFDHVPAVLAAWFPGIQAGPALVRTLLGEAIPSGKLVVSWPRSVGQEPLYYNSLSTGRPPGDADLSRPPDGNSKYISRYVDEENSPQFPFGHGLSYTSLQYGSAALSNKQLKVAPLNSDLHDGQRTVLTVSAPVTNTGKLPARETVQVYVGLRGTSTAQPVRALKGFQTIALAPGETKTISFSLPAEAFAIWNDQNQFTVEAAHATLWVSPDAVHGTPIDLDIVP